MGITWRFLIILFLNYFCSPILYYNCSSHFFFFFKKYCIFLVFIKVIWIFERLWSSGTTKNKLRYFIIFISEQTKYHLWIDLHMIVNWWYRTYHKITTSLFRWPKIMIITLVDLFQLFLWIRVKNLKTKVPDLRQL